MTDESFWCNRVKMLGMMLMSELVRKTVELKNSLEDVVY